MQRKPTKNTRGPNAQEKRFQGWVKEQSCCWCGNDGPSIVDHVKGATFKHNKELIGHFFCLPNCEVCDHKKTIEGKKLGDYADLWQKIHFEYCEFGLGMAPIDVIKAIDSWGGTWQNGK
jgi:hypothetical protein